ncbi:annexin A1-like [Alosa alosa]|uniref:annexin A1-like n=1 Tax=Alosa alosa TaxID=278164 RepID=UPI0020153F35|nr:annexin A1-like [Alosa alosa]
MQCGCCHRCLGVPASQATFQGKDSESRQSDLIMSFFKKIFKKIIHNKSDDDSDGHEGKAHVKPYHGTITPHPNFNPSVDAAALCKAIESRDVDEATIIELMVKRSNSQRQQIKAVYQQQTGKSLEEAIKSALRSDFENVVLALLMTPVQYDAYELKHAMKGFGTCECILIEILVSRSNEEVRAIKKIFKDVYDESLEQDIKNDTGGDLQEALLALCKADRCEDTDIEDSIAKSDARALYEAGENKRGTDTSVFIDIFTSRSGPQLCKIFKFYSRYGESTLVKVVDEEHIGDIDDCLMALVKCAWNMPAYFAEKLHLAMKGFGTNEDTLTRIIVSRSEVDLKKILIEYKRMFGRSLQQDILKETKGHFEKILLGLCGDN